jgi:hypothetical protein
MQNLILVVSIINLSKSGLAVRAVEEEYTLPSPNIAFAEIAPDYVDTSR